MHCVTGCTSRPSVQNGSGRGSPRLQPRREKGEQLRVDVEMATSQLKLISEGNIQGMESATFEIEKLRDQLATSAKAGSVMETELMNTRSRELRLQDDFLKAQTSCSALAKDNYRLQTGYNEVTKSAEQEISQTKNEYQQNLDALGHSLQLTQTEHDQRVRQLQDGQQTYEKLTKAALRGANQLRRDKDEKLVAMDAALHEKSEELRRREGMLKCQLEVAHENTDRVMLENDELQSTVDRLTREKRALARDLKEAMASFERSQKSLIKVEDELDEAKRNALAELDEAMDRVQMSQQEAQNQVLAQRTLAQQELENEKQAAMQQLGDACAERDQAKIHEVGLIQRKLEESESRYRDAQSRITELEGALLDEQQAHEIELHEKNKDLAQLQAEMDTVSLVAARVQTEKTALEQQLRGLRESSKKTQQELEALLDDSEQHTEMLLGNLDAQRKANTDQFTRFSQEVNALRQAAASSERAAADANYNLEATTKRLNDSLAAEHTSHQRTRNETDQVTLRLRRDLQLAREAADKYHEQCVRLEASKKLERQRAALVRNDMHDALCTVDVMKNELGAAESRCEEMEWSSELRCGRLVNDKLEAAMKAKEDNAKEKVARRLAEDQAQLAAARTRQAEDEAEELKDRLAETLRLTKRLEDEREDAFGMLDLAHSQADKMEEDQQILLGYTDAVTAQAQPAYN